MPTVNFLPNHVPHQLANEHVRRKMLSRSHARITHERGQTVSEQLGYRAGIFVCDNSRDGPRGRGVLRWKRCTSAEKRSGTISFKGPLPSKPVLEWFRCDQTIQCSFSRQKSSFAPVFAVCGITQQPHRACASDECGHPGVGISLVAAQGVRIQGQMAADVAVGGEETGSQAARRHQPIDIGKSEPRRTRPNLFLIVQRIFS